MSGVFLLGFTWAAILISLIGIVCRILALSRLPVHLRWELAPIPREKRKESYGGSYLEEYEWWKTARRTSVVGPLFFILKEIFSLHSVQRNNPSLWPFSLAMHLGIYFFIGSIFLHVASVILSLINARMAPTEAYLKVVSLAAFCGYLFGSAGSIGLLLKRVLDKDLRWSNDTGKLFNLFFLAAVFVSGGYALVVSTDEAWAVSFFIEGIIMFDTTLSIGFPLAMHVVLLLVFCAYLPFTNMIHFIGKYFIFHEVMWDDRPMNRQMERELDDLLSQPLDWAAKHAVAGEQRSWAEIAEETGDERTKS